MVSIAILVLAAIPIALVIHEWEHREHDVLKLINNYILNKKNLKRTLGYFGEGIDMVIYASFWPLLLFFVLDNFAKIGFINTISYFLSSIAILLIGKFIDKHGTRKIHGFGVLVNAILYVPRMFFSSPPLFYSLDVLDRFFSGTVSLPIMSGVYKKARKQGGSDYIIVRELAAHTGIVLVTGFILVAVKALVSWRWVFIPAMMGSMLTMLLEFDND